MSFYDICQKLKKAYSDDAVRQGLSPDGHYANAMYQGALETFIALVEKGHKPSFDSHVQWYLNQIEEWSHARD